MSHTDRVVVLVDMDCFYCQVEEQLDPQLKGKPIAVVQYNQWRGGGIIAVNYPARDRGVTRHMRGNEAKEKCPEIQLVRVPQIRGKADLSKYREAGKRVAEVLQTFTPLLERASVDEAYLDITEAVNQRLTNNLYELCADKLPNTFVVGHRTEDFVTNSILNLDYSEPNLKLAMGGLIVEEIRAKVYEITGYRCSAGIAHNKILAKLVCSLHKPNKQTILPQESIPELYEKTPLKKVKNLGGKFGNLLSQKLNIEFMSQLSKYSEKDLMKMFDEKTGAWLYNIAKGIDSEPVTVKLIPKSIGCSKRFDGKNALLTVKDVSHWLNEFASELEERLTQDFEDNNRKGKKMIVTYTQKNGKEFASSSRTINLNSYEQNKIFEAALEVINKFCLKSNGSYHIVFMGISVGNFEEVKASKSADIASFFKPVNKEPIEKDHKSELLDNLIDSLRDLKDNDKSNTSIYSAETEELDLDSDSLTYYEDVNPKAIANSSLEESSTSLKSVKSEDSITKEVSFIESDLNEVKPVERPPSGSFFAKYFESVQNSPVKRDFDTSKIFEVDDDEQEEANECKHETPADESDLKEICLECNKQILKRDMVTHMDYHFALKMVKDESHLYKKTIGNKSETNKKTEFKKKRKRDISDKKSILTFFKRIEGEEDGEVCAKCSKRIRIVDWASHQDYHIAKELHMQLNQGSTTCKKEVNKNEKKKPGGIEAFFKSM